METYAKKKRNENVHFVASFPFW